MNSPLFGFSILPTSSSNNNATANNNGTVNNNGTSNNNGTTSTNGTSITNIPGLSTALQLLDHKIQVALGLGQNLTAGFATALQQADNPAAAAGTIVQTVLEASLTIAQECPLVVVSERVLKEGIRLSIEAAKSARNIAVGTN